MTATIGAEGEKTGAQGEECTCERCKARAKQWNVRTWRWLAWHSDLTKPPLPGLRWALLLILGLSCWAAGIPLDVRDWLAPIIIAGALILPDVAGLGIAGVRVDLRQAQDDIATLRQDVNNQARASSLSILSIGGDPDRLVSTIRAFTEKVNSDQASGPDTPWQGAADVDNP